MPRKSSVSGGKAIARRFKAAVPGLLPAINEASRKALAPMRAQARANVPVDDGDLRRSIAIVRRRSARMRPVHAVGPRADFVGKDGAKPARYSSLTEFGRAANAEGGGEMQGTRWLTRAFEATSAAALRIFGATIGPAFEKQLTKRGRR